jgi:hypothetical protein
LNIFPGRRKTRNPAIPQSRYPAAATMDFLRKKLEEVEGEMVATTGTPSRSLADTSKQLVGSSWITRATAAASELQSVATKATTSLQEFSSGAAEMQELRE